MNEYMNVDLVASAAQRLAEDEVTRKTFTYVNLRYPFAWTPDYDFPSTRLAKAKTYLASIAHKHPEWQIKKRPNGY